MFYSRIILAALLVTASYTIVTTAKSKLEPSAYEMTSGCPRGTIEDMSTARCVPETAEDTYEHIPEKVDFSRIFVPSKPAHSVTSKISNQVKALQKPHTVD